MSENYPSTRAARFRGWLLGNIPTLAVFATMGGIAVWGHRTGWSAPKFADVVGAPATAPAEDWCAEHNVPESKCIKCNPQLIGANAKDWCPEHGLPESKCTLCHPEMFKAGVASDWCAEHGVPESSCTVCHPDMAIKGVTPPTSSEAVVSLDAAAGKAIKDPKACQTHALRVQFASADAVRKAGVQLGQVVERPMSATLIANAEVQYDRNRVAQMSSPVAGKIWRVEKGIGEAVKQGETIALIDSIEVGKAKGEYLQAVADQELKTQTIQRLRVSAESGFRTKTELQEAGAALKAAGIRLFNARQALVNFGLDTDAVDDQNLNAKTTSANLLALVAPFDGTVVEQNVVAGEWVESTKPLVVVADTRKLWVTADLPLADARRVKIGQAVAFQPDGSPDEGTVGKVAWISTAVDDQTRTVKVRADVENQNGRLLVHTFGQARVTIRETPNAVAVPAEAIQWEGCCYIAFVRQSDEIFQPRKVKLGTLANGHQEITVGLLPGEVVATVGSHVLKSELLKSTLGAGCADH